MNLLSKEPSFFCGIATLSMFALVTSSVAARDFEKDEKTPRFSVDTGQIAGDLTVRASGEVRVTLAQNLMGGNGDVYRVSLAFINLDDYEEAWAEVGTINFDEFENFLIRSSKGQARAVQGGQGKAATPFQQILAQAERPLCGDTVLRAFTTLPSGVKLGVNLHAAPSPIQRREVITSKNTLPVCSFDIHGDCDTWAAGGCGGPLCVNRCVVGGIPWFLLGECVEEEVFGFNTCACY